MTEHTPTDEVTGNGGPGGPHPIPAGADWNPRGPSVRRDPVAAVDALRARCPVALGPDGAWTVFSHADVMRVALDPVTYVNAVSAHLQVPNGLDGADHTAYRAVVDRYFTPERVAAVAPVVEQVAADVVAELTVPGVVDAVQVGSVFAVRAQSAWLGWPADLEDDLLRWVKDNHAATRSRDRERTARVARRFDAIVRSLIDARRGAGDAVDDITAELLRERVDGRPLTDEEVVSVLRNWTGGDLGSMALCAGVVLTFLAEHPDVQEQLRAGVPDPQLAAILDEVLRIDDPFVTNRRRATRDARLGGRDVTDGDLVLLHWTAANRDPRVFGDPDAFDPDANAPYNLVWGIGKHVCPGRPLATLELAAFVRAVLAAAVVEPAPDSPRRRALPPLGGYEAAPVHLRPPSS